MNPIKIIYKGFDVVISYSNVATCQIKTLTGEINTTGSPYYVLNSIDEELSKNNIKVANSVDKVI